MNKIYHVFFFTSLIISSTVFSMDKTDQELEEEYRQALEKKKQHQQAFNDYMEACKTGKTKEAYELLCKSNLFKMKLHFKLNNQTQTGLQLAYETGHEETARTLYPLHKYLQDEMTFSEWVVENYPDERKDNRKKRASFFKRFKTRTQ